LERFAHRVSDVCLAPGGGEAGEVTCVGGTALVRAGRAVRVGELVLFDPALGRHEVDGVVQRIPGRGKTHDLIEAVKLNKDKRFIILSRSHDFLYEIEEKLGRKIEIPVDWNSYKIIDDNYEIYPGWKVPIFEWTCECAEEEYWECDDCYYN